MIKVELTENGGWQSYELTSEQATELSGANIVEMRGGHNGGWQLRARRPIGKVGAARFGRRGDAVEVRIAPKITIDRVLFLADGKLVGDLADPTPSSVLERMSGLGG